MFNRGGDIIDCMIKELQGIDFENRCNKNLLGRFSMSKIITQVNIKRGKNEIVVKKDAKTGKVLSVKSANGKKTAKPKPLKKLRLCRIKAGKDVLKDVIDISDDAVIVTHSSPDCITYVFNGQEYEICF